MSRRASRRPRFGSVSHMHEAGGGAGSVREDIQALDYDIDESTLFHQELLRQPLEYRRRLNLYRWLICGAVGCGTGVLAFAIDCICEQLFDVKFSVAAHAMTHALRGSGSSAAAWVAGLATMSAINLLFVSVAVGLVVCVSPVAGGSGIPEVKAYLQGVKVPRMLRFDALLAKSVGVLCAVASGLVVGKEGPMIHIGAIIAAGVSQGSSKSLNVRAAHVAFRDGLSRASALPEPPLPGAHDVAQVLPQRPRQARLRLGRRRRRRRSRVRRSKQRGGGRSTAHPHHLCMRLVA